MAQFNHSEFSGPGQWMRGSMTMVSDMFNHVLKARVDALCSELSDFVVRQPLLGPGDGALPEHPDDVKPWANLGRPDSTGSQNGMRCAYYTGTRRLVIEDGDQVTVHDTGDHRITGCAQQQSGVGTLSFSSLHGVVDLTGLPVIGVKDASSRTPQGKPMGELPVPVREVGPLDGSVAPTGRTAEICFTIERLADLHRNNILSDDKIARKKSKLLDRL